MSMQYDSNFFAISMENSAQQLNSRYTSAYDCNRIVIIVFNRFALAQCQSDIHCCFQYYFTELKAIASSEISRFFSPLIHFQIISEQTWKLIHVRLFIYVVMNIYVNCEQIYYTAIAWELFKWQIQGNWSHLKRPASVLFMFL